MSRLPFPHILSQQERANLEAVENIHPLNFVYFTFDITNWKKSKPVIRLPKNSMVYGVVTIKVIDPFEATSTSGDIFLYLGSDNTRDSIGSINLGGRTIHTFWPNNADASPDYFTPFNSPVNIVVSLGGIPNSLLQGRGNGVFQWLDLNRVKGFR